MGDIVCGALATAPQASMAVPHVFCGEVSPTFAYLERATGSEVPEIYFDLPLRYLLRGSTAFEHGQGVPLWIVGLVLWGVLGGLLLGCLIAVVWGAWRDIASGEPSVRVHGAPGMRLITWTEFFFSRKDREHLIQPILDMRVEYFEALSEKRQWKARMVLVRGYLAFLNTVWLHVALRFGKRVVAVWRFLP